MALLPIGPLPGQANTPGPWTWFSPEYTMGDPSQLKRLYGVQMTVLSGTVIYPSALNSASYALDGTNIYWTLALDSNGKSTAPAPGYQFKTIRIRLIATDTNVSVTSLTILYRKMIGLR